MVDELASKIGQKAKTTEKTNKNFQSFLKISSVQKEVSVSQNLQLCIWVTESSPIKGR